jgi:parallel beta-helix repeat protein
MRKTIQLTKRLALVIAILFFLTPSLNLVCSSTARNTRPIIFESSQTMNTTIYVDDDNTQGPWDGSLQHPYQRIQDGVNHATYGNTVYVFSGTYHEHVRITITIFLIGEDKQTTIIDADHDSYCIDLEAGNVHVSGFTLQNSGMHPSERDGGVSIYNYFTSSHRNVIHDNIIIDNYYGVVVYFSNENVIENNTIIRNKFIGIQLEPYSYNNTILNNSILENGWTGIELEEYIYNTRIHGNIIMHNDYGIQLFSSENTTISNNNISSNNRTGIFLVMGNSKIKISYNNISKNGDTGIKIEANDNHENTIVSNDLQNNTMNGIIASSPKDVYSRNRIIGSQNGIVVSGRSCSIRDNYIGSTMLGLSIELASPCTVERNTFLGNQNDATFTYCLRDRFLIPLFFAPQLTRWQGNFWEQPLSAKKTIDGVMILSLIFGHGIPWKNFDFSPASTTQWRSGV